MKKRLLFCLRMLSLLLLLPLLGIAFSPPTKTIAQCNATGSQIQVDAGLISAINISNFDPLTGVSCIEGQPASIPQFSIQTYDEMKKDYFDQAKSTFNKITIQGNQTQNSASSPINLLSL